MTPRNTAARGQGARAVLANRLHGAPPPVNPYPARQMRHRYFALGQQQAAQLVDRLDWLTR